MPSVRRVVFPVAGLGTRFLPATKTIPKEMLPVVDKPLIQYAVEEAVEAGGELLVFVTSRKKHAINDHFEKDLQLEAVLEQRGKLDMLEAVRRIQPEYVRRAEVPQPEALGLGHAVLCAKRVVGDQPFGIILADDMIKSSGDGCLKQMVEVYEKTGASVIAVQEVDPQDTDQYGICATEPHGERTERLVSIVEKPAPADAPSNLAVVGRYVLSPKIFSILEQTEPGAGGEIQLTDAISTLLESEEVLCYRFRGTRYDCGSKMGFVQATLEYALDHPDLKAACEKYLHSLLHFELPKRDLSD